MQRARAFGVAAEMSFWLFLAAIPLAVVAGLLVARVVVGRADLLQGIIAATPMGASSWVSDQLSHVAAWNGGAVAPVAAVVFVWLASSGVHSVFDGLEVEVGVSRPWWKKRILAILTCAAVSAGVAAATLLGTGLVWLYRFGGIEAPRFVVALEESGALAVVRMIISFVLLVGLMALVYRVGVPKRAGRRFPIFRGALLAALLNFVLAFGYRFYLSNVGLASAYLAGIATLGVTLMLLYLFAVSLLAGAELNRVLSDRRAIASGGANAPVARLPN
jgi:membrane protein